MMSALISYRALASTLLLASVVMVGAPSARAEQSAVQYHSENGPLSVTELVTGLDHPWALAFLPAEQGQEQAILITERVGTLRLWRASTGLSKPLSGVPRVYAKSQGGLLDIAVSPDFKRTRMVYMSYAEAGDNGMAGTTVGAARLSDDNLGLENFKVIFRQEPKLSRGEHFGSRLVFDRSGYLFIALGENNQRATAQDLSKLQGKVVRIYPDGRIPQDNPFVGRGDARPEIWSYGHRNQQGAALNPWSGQLWTDEHGPKGGDEVNIPQAGKNYGWPLATYGINYSGQAIPEATGTAVPGTEQPTYYWKVSPAVSGMAFYSASHFPAWQGSMFTGALAGKTLIRLQLKGNQVVHEERMLSELGERIRDVRSGPDGYLYVLTDSGKGSLLKVGLSP